MDAAAAESGLGESELQSNITKTGRALLDSTAEKDKKHLHVCLLACLMLPNWHFQKQTEELSTCVHVRGKHTVAFSDNGSEADQRVWVTLFLLALLFAS